MEREAEVIDFHKHTVFNRDPFAIDPLPKSHYYPSPERKIKARQRCIEGKALVERKTESQQRTNDRLSPMDEFFMKGSNVYQAQTHATEIEDEINFDESWPTSEKPSSLSLSGLEDDSPIDLERYRATLDKFTNIKKAIKFVDKENHKTGSEQRLRKPGAMSQSNNKIKVKKTDPKSASRIPVKHQKGSNKVSGTSKPMDNQAEVGEGSVLQRYVERFRNSAPMSRDQRDKLQNGSAHDFWWMEDKNEGLGPSYELSPRDHYTDERKSRKITPLTEENLDKYSSFTGEKKSKYKDWSASPGHKKTVELQERAEKLLERSSSTVLSTEPAVSTEGLGSNMSDMSSLDEYSYRPPFAEYIEHIPKYQADIGGQTGGAKTFVHPSRPDEDPLYQWRLRRRMDQAKETPPTNVASFGFLTKTEQQKKIDAKLEEFKQRLAGKEPAPANRSRPTNEKRVEQTIDIDRSERTTHSTLTGRLQFTPAPAQYQKDICDKTNEKEPPTIASPTLHRHKGRVMDGQPVDPHLHLMCDLLPCPHQNEYRERYSVHEDGTKTGNTDDSYRQYLEAEKPDVEKKSEKRQNVKYSDDAHEVRERNVGHDLKKTKSHKDRTENIIGNHIGENKNIVNVNNINVDKCDKPDDLSDNCDKRQRSGERDGSDSGDEERDIKSQGSRDKGNVIKPTSSSSPKIGRRTVDSAIGQTIKDHLFSTTTSTVLSSVDSLPPSASVTRLDRKQRKGKHIHSTDMEEYESDGDFGDDHLLQMLRKQRSLYEQQLQQIDQKLKILEDRG